MKRDRFAGEKSDQELPRTMVGIFGAYNDLYSDLSGGRASNYEGYVKLGLADEENLIQPTLFPEFLDHILGFSKIDYTPELRALKVT